MFRTHLKKEGRDVEFTNFISSNSVSFASMDVCREMIQGRQEGKKDRSGSMTRLFHSLEFHTEINVSDITPSYLI
jgi:hypothetical protein